MSIMNFIRSKRFPKNETRILGNLQELEETQTISSSEFSQIPSVAIGWLALVLLIFFGTGCATANLGPGSLEVRLWDHREAIDDFSELQLTFSAIGIHPANQPRSEGWIELTPSIQELDLTHYVDGQQAVIATAEVKPDSYDAVRLTVDQAVGVLKDGQSVEVEVRFDAIALDFQINSGQITVLGLDLMVLDLSDHPDQGYELHLRDATIIRGG